MEPLIVLKDVYFRYTGSDEYSLKNINFEAKSGEYILITGPSGCGKSTLTRVLNGLIPNFYNGELKGEIKVVGLDTRRTPAYIMAKHIGTVFQDPENQLFLSSVEREIAFSLENLGFEKEIIKRRVEDVIEMFGLKDLRDKAPYELSGGQQQKVAIASVIAVRPKILILDEPTANLDPMSAVEVLRLIKELVTNMDILAIVIEHRLEIALKYATRMIIMNKGEIIADGDPKKIVLSDEANIIGIPKVVEICKRLISENIYLKDVPLSPKELAKYLAKVISENGR